MISQKVFERRTNNRPDSSSKTNIYILITKRLKIGHVFENQHPLKSFNGQGQNGNTFVDSHVS